jgi:hypothetical protein
MNIYLIIKYFKIYLTKSKEIGLQLTVYNFGGSSTNEIYSIYSKVKFYPSLSKIYSSNVFFKIFNLI